MVNNIDREQLRMARMVQRQRQQEQQQQQSESDSDSEEESPEVQNQMQRISQLNNMMAAARNPG